MAKQSQTSLPELFETLNHRLASLSFALPVTHVYNPLLYAQASFQQYSERFLQGPPARTLLLGMNPGPWGMAQTGVPFGEVNLVKEWMKIEAPIGQPKRSHPKRPVSGFDCPRSEVSGRRLWSLFQELYPRAEDFAKDYVVFNYCPLIFLEESGRNRTPDKLPKAERDALYEVCDDCLDGLLRALKIETALGVGKFAEKKLEQSARRGVPLKTIDSILHPSPASPAANKDWAGKVRPILSLGKSEK